MYYCPFSIDTTWVLAVAKAMLIAAGRGSPILTEIADASISKGENISLFKDVIVDMLKDTEKEPIQCKRRIKHGCLLQHAISRYV